MMKFEHSAKNHVLLIISVYPYSWNTGSTQNKALIRDNEEGGRGPLLSLKANSMYSRLTIVILTLLYFLEDQHMP